MKKGFTLIELLVVIAIIALLLSILMPSLQMVKEKAKAVVCRSNCRQNILASRLYSEDNDDNTLPSWQATYVASGYVMGTQWYVLLQDYHDESYDVVHCPSARKPQFTPAGMSVNGDARLSWYIDPAHPLVFDVPGTDKDNWGGYGYNNWLEVSIYAAAENFITKTTDTGRADAGRVPVFGDCVWAEAGWTYATNPVVPEDCRDDPWGNNYGVGTHFGSQRYSINRHHDGINMGFLDGHADYVAVDDLKKLYWHKNWRTTYVAEDNEG